MNSTTYPLAVPDDLLEEVRHVAKRTSLSVADTLRQSVKLGLPKLMEQLSPKDLLEHHALVADTWQKLGPAPEIDYDEL